MELLEAIKDSNIAIVGGGRFCRTFLDFLLAKDLGFRPPAILGVADKDKEGAGIRFAETKGIFTTTDYRDLFHIENLNVLIELTDSFDLAETIRKSKPPHVRLIDHIDVRAMWSVLQIRSENIETRKAIRGKISEPKEVLAEFERFAERIEGIVLARARETRETERGLIESRSAISQIIDGSSIPTFVIDGNHVVTHWNKACEQLTGYPAAEIVGTQNQWKPFRSEKRPIMADLILDGARRKEKEVLHYYGLKWRKSELIKGAYEVEEYFPNLGEGGKWLFFTGAPIKSTEGRVIGIIETLWDKTAEKKAEEEKDRHNKMLAETARELAKSEKTMAEIIQGSTAPTFVINKDHVITHWNKALEKLTGYSARDMVGTRKQWVPFWESERPSMADVVLEGLEEEAVRKIYGERLRRSELIEDAYEAEEFVPKLGKKGRWCFFTAAPIKADDGTIIAAIETLWDRTAKKIAEEERDRHTQELYTLCSVYSGLSQSDDLETRLEMASREICNYLNADTVSIYTIEEDGRYRLKYTNTDCRDESTAPPGFGEDDMIGKVYQSGRPVLFEDIPGAKPPMKGFRSLAYIPIQTKGKKGVGVIRIASKRAHHFSDEEKNVLDLIGNRIGAAIENSMLQEQVLKSEEKYRTLFNNAPNPIFILDSRNFKIRDINERTQVSYGYRREELLGMSFLSLGEESDAELVLGLKKALEGQSFLFTKKRHFRKGGHPFYVNIKFSSAKYGDEDVILATTTDITESVEKETQLIQAGKMTTLGTMAAGMAHEINQPLNVIQICADFFQKQIKRGKTIGDEELKTLAEDISSNVQRAVGIINHMRNFARQSESVTTQVNVNQPIHDVFKVMGHQLKVHQIQLKLDLAPDLPPISAEHNRLEQVFINLVTNAVSAMDEKAAQAGNRDRERVLEIRSFTEKDRVVVTVSDTGTGMSKAIMNKIFEPFFTTKEVGKGTGLGLAISYGIIKEYKGTIDIKSEVGVGTTFRISFPAMHSEIRK